MPGVCVRLWSIVKSEIFKLSCLGGQVLVSQITHTHKLLENMCVLRCRSTLLTPEKCFLFPPFSVLICVFRLSSFADSYSCKSANSSPTVSLFLLLAFSLSSPPPPTAAVGQTSLVVSSVDFLEPLRGARGLLASNIISAKDTEP